MLVVGFVLDEAAGVFADEEFAQLVVGEDDGGEGQRHEPHEALQRVHPQRRLNTQAYKYVGF